jgi:hypothetical protein
MSSLNVIFVSTAMLLSCVIYLGEGVGLMLLVRCLVLALCLGLILLVCTGIGSLCSGFLADTLLVPYCHVRVAPFVTISDVVLQSEYDVPWSRD